MFIDRDGDQSNLGSERQERVVDHMEGVGEYALHDFVQRHVQLVFGVLRWEIERGVCEEYLPWERIDYEPTDFACFLDEQSADLSARKFICDDHWLVVFAAEVDCAFELIVLKFDYA